ncbi:proliferation-associated protein 2G4 [Panicum miliaceum]|uniref:Proliferation-associated protein 2G4 n=1 Tax=Panicum miliaceum TaxID=4540 RepID=A0A3L6T7C8_PANMI|nr:proliferation-associated protein 2G4 [Panicum miliaceum]
MGCHVDGCIAMVAHTHTIIDGRVTGQADDVLEAANIAAQVTLQLVRPGVKEMFSKLPGMFCKWNPNGKILAVATIGGDGLSQNIYLISYNALEDSICYDKFYEARGGSAGHDTVGGGAGLDGVSGIPREKSTIKYC